MGQYTDNQWRYGNPSGGYGLGQASQSVMHGLVDLAGQKREAEYRNKELGLRRYEVDSKSENMEQNRAHDADQRNLDRELTESEAALSRDQSIKILKLTNEGKREVATINNAPNMLLAETKAADSGQNRQFKQYEFTKKKNEDYRLQIDRNAQGIADESYGGDINRALKEDPEVQENILATVAGDESLWAASAILGDNNLATKELVPIRKDGKLGFMATFEDGTMSFQEVDPVQLYRSLGRSKERLSLQQASIALGPGQQSQEAPNTIGGDLLDQSGVEITPEAQETAKRNVANAQAMAKMRYDSYTADTVNGRQLTNEAAQKSFNDGARIRNGGALENADEGQAQADVKKTEANTQKVLSEIELKMKETRNAETEKNLTFASNSYIMNEELYNDKTFLGWDWGDSQIMRAKFHDMAPENRTQFVKTILDTSARNNAAILHKKMGMPKNVDQWTQNEWAKFNEVLRSASKDNDAGVFFDSGRMGQIKPSDIDKYLGQ